MANLMGCIGTRKMGFKAEKKLPVGHVFLKIIESAWSDPGEEAPGLHRPPFNLELVRK
jgi:hypothetical protein